MSILSYLVIKGKACIVIIISSSIIIQTVYFSGVKVSAQLTIVSGLEWRTDLLNNKSRHYKNETNKVVNEVYFSFIIIAVHKNK